MASKRAQRRKERRKACDGKVAHRSRRDALTAKFKGGKDYAAVWAYECKFCGMWHLGHPKAKWLLGR